MRHDAASRVNSLFRRSRARSHALVKLAQQNRRVGRIKTPSNGRGTNHEGILQRFALEGFRGFAVNLFGGVCVVVVFDRYVIAGLVAALIDEFLKLVPEIR